MDLTTKQLVVLDYIKRFIAEHGYSPTVREICTGLALKSPATVHEHIKKLVQKGIITINPTKSRTIELLVENEYVIPDREIVKIPIIDEHNLTDNARQYLSVPDYMLNGYDPKNLCAYVHLKTTYIINKSIKENTFKYGLYLDNKKHLL